MTTTSSPAIFPLFRAFTAAGLPANGYKLYTYAAGTSTPQATYTDSTLGVANANPVILDASGSAPVWMGTSAYKFVLKDSLDVTIWTADQINQGGVSAATKAQVIVAAGLPTFVTGTWTNMFGSGATLIYDALGNFNTTTGTFTVPSTARYLLTYYGDISAAGTSFTSGYTVPRVGGTDWQGAAQGLRASLTNVANKLTGGAVCGVVSLTANDAVTMGANLTFTGTAPACIGSLLSIVQL